MLIVHVAMLIVHVQMLIVHVEMQIVHVEMLIVHVEMSFDIQAIVMSTDARIFFIACKRWNQIYFVEPNASLGCYTL